ncbi:transposon Tf2-1 polyprotein isoform X1 [Cucumis melo var. makuwa]|uniref:Transposon Tf2-1 polyprotein isoform X1 n=1 Tax=Cucumis melo var. makuwa TaxID=1194695 RepID=A0A5A7SWN4_CUCMM|nr:transposon Tf2-1 polyprotein isoform X1 [Cucumis melo var. makuwa]TYK01255.1 transposon Tf2-1 polyprotein isoform X1 [Cucumis melo var. makuwa]
MIQIRIEERLEIFDQEIMGIRSEQNKLPVIEEKLMALAKNIEYQGPQAEKQQQLMFRFMETTAKERLAMSERITESNMLLIQFRSIREGSICGWFMGIKQESTVEEYRNLFDKLVAPLLGLQDKVVEETFMNRLLPWIKAEVEFCEPVELAQRVENREIIRNEYLADHKCKAKEQRELRMLVVKSDEEELEIIEEDKVEKGVERRTMKVRGKIQDREVVVLIDYGTTHNFISEKLVNDLQLSTRETSHYGVILGSGTAMKGKGIYEAIELSLNE